MARLVRIAPPGTPLHLVVRGNDHQSIFHGDGDRVFFHRCLVEARRRYGLAVHAYVFMTNHVHLLATPSVAGATSRTLQSVGRRYVAYFNKMYQRTGTLWEGRFRSSPVASDHHLLACYRYIEMNPVRARMTAIPEQHIWSSHRCNLGLAADDLVEPHSLFLGISTSDAKRVARYRSLCAEALDPALIERMRDCLNHGWAFGDDAWCEQIGALTGRRARRVGPSRAPVVEPRGLSNGEHSDPSGDPVGQPSREVLRRPDRGPRATGTPRSPAAGG